MRLRRLVAVGLAFLGSAALARIDPARFQDLRWRLIGPFRGGRVLAVSGVPGEPEHFYFGSVNGGVWESRDAGRTWQPIFDGQPIGSIGALAIAPSNPRVVYVGTGEADMRSDIAQGDGVYRSTDGGRTWAHVGLADTQQIGRVLVHPQDAETVYVAALGHPYGPNAERGVYRSRDGGKSWTKVLGPDDATGAIDLAFEPGNPRVVYAALWQVRRTPWSVYPPASGPGSGLYKSSDGGDTWTQLTKGLPARCGRIGVAVAPSSPRRVYAIVDAEEGGGLYRSDDAGASFVRASDDSRIWQRGWYFGGIAVEPQNPDVVYAGNTALYRSADGGKTFVPIKGAPGGDDYHELWIDPQHPERRILGVDQGAVVSVNGGETWSSWYNQPTGQFYHVATDGQFPYWVYGSQQDSGAAAVPSRTNTYDGITLREFRETSAGGESDNVAPDPLDPQVLYGGRVTRLDLRTGQARSVRPTLAHPDLYRATWTLPLVFSRRDPHVLYFAHQRVFRTADGGDHWTLISPDLTREDPGTPANLDALTAANNLQAGPRRGVVYAIAPSRVADHDLWVGTDDGLVWRTRDEGGHWENVTPAGLTGWSKVGILETSHFDADTAYAAVDRHRLDDFRPYVYRTHDGGRTWQLVAAGIPDGSFVNAVREDPVRRGLLYAGTEKGVYVSFDDGESWQSLQRNLPVTSVRDLEVHGDDLVIATHGRAFWVMDDVAPLRQAEALAGDEAVLFAPAAAIRLRPAGFTGTPMPKDEALAANPPAGAYLDYFLRAPAKAVAIEIRDAQDALVRRYTSADAPPGIDLARLEIAPGWVRTPLGLPTTPGMHRFVWPLRYPSRLAPTARPGGNAFADGVWAPPGRYTVVLEVDGRRSSQPLTVAPDPRMALAADAYQRQFALAREIEETGVAVASARRDAEALLGGLAERRQAAKGELAKRIDALERRVLDVSGIVVSANRRNAWWLPPRSTSSLRFVESALGDLGQAVDGADEDPWSGGSDVALASDAVTGFAKLRPVARAAVDAWKALVANDLAALNRELGRAGQKPIALAP